MRLPIIVLSLACMIAFASPAHALSGGRDDVDTAAANATVSLNGGNCTGTLIAPQLVLTAGHCGSIDPGRLREVDGTFVPMGQWWRLASPFTVRISRDPNVADASRTYTATYMTQAGWADIQIIMLDRPVPASQAIPVRPLTQLNATQHAAGFWNTQSFTVAGFGGGRTPRQTADWSNGRYPCKNAPHLIANDEFMCALTHNGAELESGDSGGPIYWVDPTTRVRYVLGAYQGNVQFMRLCDPADGAVGCSMANWPIIVAGPGGCRRETEENARAPAWAPQHHTAVFFNTGGCWTDLAGRTRRQPNIAQWIDNAIRWAPTAADATIPVVLQRSAGANPRLEISVYQGSDVYATLSSAVMINAHAPNTWPLGARPLWRWRVEGPGDRVQYTSMFPGHAFSRREWNEVTLHSPSLVGYLWPNRTDAPNLVALNIYTNTDTREWITTWSLEEAIPNAAERARWHYTTQLGFVQVAPPRVVLRPIAPVTPGRTLPPIRN